MANHPAIYPGSAVPAARKLHCLYRASARVENWAKRFTMKWFAKRDGFWVCAPYQLIRSTHGWDAWVHSKARNGVLGRRMSLERAKALCETDAAAHA